MFRITSVMDGLADVLASESLDAARSDRSVSRDGRSGGGADGLADWRASAGVLTWAACTCEPRR